MERVAESLLFSDKTRNKKIADSGGDYPLFLVEATGFAPLAARPAPTLSTSSFAVKFFIIQLA